MWCLAAAFALVQAGAAIASPQNPASRPAPAAATAVGRFALLPQTPGHHRLFHVTPMPGGSTRKLAYLAILPPGYGDRPGPWPMVVFMHGAGEVGNTHDAMYTHGPAAELKRNPDLAARQDYIVLSPQCPGGLRWESPGMTEAAVDIIRMAMTEFDVDRGRVYVTGLSMGGAGTWRVALHGAGLFAAVAPISSVAVEPEKMAAAMQGATAWVLVGSNDGECTTGSERMAKTLRAAGVDTIHTIIPGGDHFVWGRFYANRLFYDFLLMHRRGVPPPPNRPIAEELLAISYQPPNSMDAKLAEPFKKFLPYWWLLNCGQQGPPGLRGVTGASGNTGVPPVASGAGQGQDARGTFVTSPLDATTPCRMITTVKVPEGKLTHLLLRVGRFRHGAWHLTVRGNEQDLHRVLIGQPSTTSAASKPTTKPGQEEIVWQDEAVDLTAFAGSDVRLQLVSAASGQAWPVAYWQRVEVVSKDPPRQAPAASVLPVIEVVSEVAHLRWHVVFGILLLGGLGVVLVISGLSWLRGRKHAG